MRTRSSFRLLVVATAALPIAAVACAIGETTNETIRLPAKLKMETVTCDSPFAKPDITKLKECGQGVGKGHCYDKKKVPIPAAKLPACEGEEVCTPDGLLKAGGKKPKACTFFLDSKPGACTSLLIKDVQDFKDQMKQDVCAADERCAPCINPLDGQPTHLCDDAVGVHEGDCVGGTADDSKDCCHGAGVCMTEEGAPAESRDNMKRDSCPAKHLCAPAAMASGKPVKCDVLGALDGVCLDLCFAEMFKSTIRVMRSSCGPTEVCMPCVLGASQGMPGCD